MSGRTFVVIFVCWALLTIITPMLVSMSRSARHKPGSHVGVGDWWSNEMRTRKMMSHLKKEQERLRSSITPFLQELPQAPAPAPGSGSEMGRAGKRLKTGAAPKPQDTNMSAFMK